MTALDLYQEVTRQQPDNPEVCYYIARIYSRSKEHEMAIKSLHEVYQAEQEKRQTLSRSRTRIPADTEHEQRDRILSQGGKDR
jgi:hypothetical protein